MIDESNGSVVARLGALSYRPIAQQRLKHLYFDCMPEVHVARRFLKAVQAARRRRRAEH